LSHRSVERDVFRARRVMLATGSFPAEGISEESRVLIIPS